MASSPKSPEKLKPMAARSQFNAALTEAVDNLRVASDLVKKVYALPAGKQFKVGGEVFGKGEAGRAMTIAINDILGLKKVVAELITDVTRSTRKSGGGGGAAGFSKPSYWDPRVVQFFQSAAGVLGNAATIGAGGQYGISSVPLVNFLTFLGGNGQGVDASAATSVVGRALLNPLFAIYARNAKLAELSTTNRRIANGERVQKVKKNGELKVDKNGQPEYYEKPTTGNLGSDALMNQYFGDVYAAVTAKSIADNKTVFDPNDFRHSAFQQLLSVLEVKPAKGSAEANAYDIKQVPEVPRKAYMDLMKQAKDSQKAKAVAQGWSEDDGRKHLVFPIDFDREVSQPFNAMNLGGAINAFPQLERLLRLAAEQQIVSQANVAQRGTNQ